MSRHRYERTSSVRAYNDRDPGYGDNRDRNNSRYSSHRDRDRENHDSRSDRHRSSTTRCSEKFIDRQNGSWDRESSSRSHRHNTSESSRCGSSVINNHLPISLSQPDHRRNYGKSLSLEQDYIDETVDLERRMFEIQQELKALDAEEKLQQEKDKYLSDRTPSVHMRRAVVGPSSSFADVPLIAGGRLGPAFDFQYGSQALEVELQLERKQAELERKERELDERARMLERESQRAGYNGGGNYNNGGGMGMYRAPTSSIRYSPSSHERVMAPVPLMAVPTIPSQHYYGGGGGYGGGGPMRRTGPVGKSAWKDDYRAEKAVFGRKQTRGVSRTCNSKDSKEKQISSTEKEARDLFEKNTDNFVCEPNIREAGRLSALKAIDLTMLPQGMANETTALVAEEVVDTEYNEEECVSSIRSKYTNFLLAEPKKKSAVETEIPVVDIRDRQAFSELARWNTMEASRNMITSTFNV